MVTALRLLLVFRVALRSCSDRVHNTFPDGKEFGCLQLLKSSDLTSARRMASPAGALMPIRVRPPCVLTILIETPREGIDISSPARRIRTSIAPAPSGQCFIPFGESRAFAVVLRIRRRTCQSENLCWLLRKAFFINDLRRFVAFQ